MNTKYSWKKPIQTVLKVESNRSARTTCLLFLGSLIDKERMLTSRINRVLTKADYWFDAQHRVQYTNKHQTDTQPILTNLLLSERRKPQVWMHRNRVSPYILHSRDQSLVFGLVAFPSLAIHILHSGSNRLTVDSIQGVLGSRAQLIFTHLAFISAVAIAYKANLVSFACPMNVGPSGKINISERVAVAYIQYKIKFRQIHIPGVPLKNVVHGNLNNIYKHVI